MNELLSLTCDELDSIAGGVIPPTNDNPADPNDPSDRGGCIPDPFTPQLTNY